MDLSIRDFQYGVIRPTAIHVDYAFGHYIKTSV